MGGQEQKSLKKMMAGPKEDYSDQSGCYGVNSKADKKKRI